MSKKVFLASRFSEFENIRKKIISHYRDSDKIEIVNLDPNGVDVRTPTIKSIDTVSTCDMLLLLVGDSYGIIPNGYNVSITHLEYVTALELGTPILAFYIGQNNQSFLTYFAGDDEHPKLKELKHQVFSPSVNASIISSLNSHAANSTNIVCEKIDVFLADKDSFQNNKNRPYGYGLKKKPSIYIRREDEINEIKNLIINNNKNIGIVGIGGIGKSILIADIVQNNEIREEFENAYAVDVGKEPDLREIVVKLLDYIPHYRYYDIENIAFNSAINRLKDFFRNKKILLILDDVWDSSIIDHLNFINKESKIIATTRKESVIVNFETYHLGLLNEEEAQKLFYGINPSKKIDIELTKKVIAKTGKLPLAIKIIASRLKNKPYKLYQEFLDNFQLSRVEYEVEDKTQRNLFNVVEFTYNDLNNTVKDDLLLLSIFPEDALIKVETLETYLGYSWSDTIGVLIEYHLINYEEDTHGIALYQFHDLIREYIAEKSKSLEKDINRKYIKSYYDRYNGQWNSMPYYESFFFKNFIQISKKAELFDLGKSIAEGIIWEHSNLHEKTVEKIISFLDLEPKATARKLIKINKFKGTKVMCLKILGNRDRTAIEFSKNYLKSDYIHFEIATRIITDFAIYDWVIKFAENWIEESSFKNPYITASCIKVLDEDNIVSKEFIKEVISTDKWKYYDFTIICNSINQSSQKQVEDFLPRYLAYNDIQYQVITRLIDKIGVENDLIKRFAKKYFDLYPLDYSHPHITSKLLTPFHLEEFALDFAYEYLKSKFKNRIDVTNSCLKVYALRKERTEGYEIPKDIIKICTSYLMQYTNIRKLNTDLNKKRTNALLISTILRLLKFNTNSSRIFITNFLAKEIRSRGQNHIILQSCLTNIPKNADSAISFADYIYNNNLMADYRVFKSKILLIKSTSSERFKVCKKIVNNWKFYNTPNKKEILNSALIATKDNDYQSIYFSILKDWKNQIKKIEFKGSRKGNARKRAYYHSHLVTCIELLVDGKDKKKLITKMKLELMANPRRFSATLKETIDNYK